MRQDLTICETQENDEGPAENGQYCAMCSFVICNMRFAGEKAASYIPGTEANREKKDNQGYGNTGYGSSTGTGTGTGYGSSNTTTGYNSSGTGTGTGYNSSGTGTGYGSNTSGTGTGTGTGYGSNTSGTAGMTTGKFASCTFTMLNDDVLIALGLLQLLSVLLLSLAHSLGSSCPTMLVNCAQLVRRRKLTVQFQPKSSHNYMPACVACA